VFAPRTRYYGFQQILPYVQAGSTIYPTELTGPERLSALAIGGGAKRPGDLTIAAINRAGPIDMTISLDGPAPPAFEVYVTDRERHFEHVGRVMVRNGQLAVTVPARSVTSFSAGPPPDEDLGE
jgi:hypothetical protein